MRDATTTNKLTTMYRVPGFVAIGAFHRVYLRHNRTSVLSGRTRPFAFRRPKFSACSPTAPGTSENENFNETGRGRDTKETTIISWNVNSIRALVRKDPNALQNLVKEYNPDILCLQETKLQEMHEHLFEKILEDCGLKYSIFNSSTARLGYSGTAMYMRAKPRFVQTEVRHEGCDSEGRMLAVDYAGITIVNVYTVNAGSELRRLPVRQSWDEAFRRFLREKRTSGNSGADSSDGVAADRRPIVVVGDLNVAHREIDVHDSGKVKGLAGFTSVERDGLEDMMETVGLVDVYRERNVGVGGKFTYWDYRTHARKDNRGWRIDYVLVSDESVKAVKDVQILDHVGGSDHCPVVVTLGPGFIDYSGS